MKGGRAGMGNKFRAGRKEIRRTGEMQMRMRTRKLRNKRREKAGDGGNEERKDGHGNTIEEK
jgi:hypothetical protein